MLSIIIVNWNTRDLLANCLSSVRDIAAPCEVIVVDNASTDGSATAVQEGYRGIRLIAQAENQGYARANMNGFRFSTGQYVLFLNSDTVLPSGAVEGLMELLEKEPRIAACGPKLLIPGGKAQPYAFGCDPSLSYLISRVWARLGLRAPLHDWETAAVQPVDWISGACLLVRRSAFELVGGFDEQIFMYFEDNDLCLRMRRAGWQVVYYPLVAVTHLGGSSLSSNARRREYYYGSLRYFYSKHYSRFDRLVLRLLLPLYRRCFG